MQWKTKWLHVTWGVAWLVSSMVMGVCFVRQPVLTVFAVLSAIGVVTCGYLFAEVFHEIDE